MSVFCLKNPDAVFIGIPKTGSSTIREGLWEKRYKAHYGVGMPRYAADLIAAGQLSFAFVRHPLDRLASAHRDFTQIRKYVCTEKEFTDIVLDRSVSYDLLGVKNKIRHHTLPLTHPAYALDYAKLVFRYEQYETHVRKFCGLLGFDIATVPRVKATKGVGYMNFVDRLDAGRCAAIVDYYAEDLERFEYVV